MFSFLHEQIFTQQMCSSTIGTAGLEREVEPVNQMTVNQTKIVFQSAKQVSAEKRNYDDNLAQRRTEKL